MSGHEKHYIPHDDLVELKTAIDSLETAIETLETSILTFSTALINNTTLAYTQCTRITEAEAEEETIYNSIISATDNLFVRYVLAFVYHATANPLLKYNSDILLFTNASTQPYFMHEPVFGDSGRAMPLGVSLWRYVKMWPVNNIIIPAGNSYQVTVNVSNIRIGTTIIITTVYTKGV